MQVSTILRLVDDPERKTITTKSGEKTVCQVRGAVDSAGRDFNDGFFNFSQIGPGGEAAASVLTKGQQVYFEGRAVHSEWRDKDTKKYRERVEFIGKFTFLDKKHVEPTPDKNNGEAARRKDDNIPF